MDPVAVLSHQTALSMASEYVAYRGWCARRNVVYVAPLHAYFADAARRLGISLASVEEQVRLMR